MNAHQINGNALNVTAVNPGVNAARSTGQELKTQNFRDVLTDAIGVAGGLRFSKHASTRLGSREVNLSDEQLKRVEKGVNTARSKGITDSLVLVDDYALVVNTPSNTVITAMRSAGKSDGIFTNINGAVIV